MMLVLKGVLWHHTLFYLLKTSFNIQAYTGQKLQNLIRKYEILSTHCGVSSSSPSFFPVLTLLVEGDSFCITHCRICLVAPKMTVTLASLGIWATNLCSRSEARTSGKYVN